MSETPDDDIAPSSEVTQNERQQHEAVQLALRLLWRGRHGSRVVRRMAGSLDWPGYCAEIEAVRTTLREEYAMAVAHSEVERGETAQDLDAALLVALHYFHAKEAPPLPLPAGVLDSTGDLLRFFAQQALAGRWNLSPP